MNQVVIIDCEGFIENINQCLLNLPILPNHHPIRKNANNEVLYGVIGTMVQYAGYPANNRNDLMLFLQELYGWWDKTYIEEINLLVQAMSKFVAFLQNKYRSLRLLDSDGACPLKFFGWQSNRNLAIILKNPDVRWSYEDVSSY